MNLMRYQPRTLDLFNWDRVFNRFFDDSVNGLLTPAVDVREDDKQYNMEVELPGLSEKEVNVKIENDVLTISSKKEDSTEEKEKGFIRKERRHFSFSRSFALPDNVDADNITATFKNGLLNVVIPKTPEAKPKLIEVKVR